MSRYRQTFRLLVAVAVVGVLLSPPPANAQGASGTLSGTVQDTQGGVIPGATVTLISESRGTTSSPVVTNASGDFVIPNVAPVVPVAVR
jgi:Carboxypeptidase regulatory-like domain